MLGRSVWMLAVVLGGASTEACAKRPRKVPAATTTKAEPSLVDMLHREGWVMMTAFTDRSPQPGDVLTSDPALFDTGPSCFEARPSEQLLANIEVVRLLAEGFRVVGGGGLEHHPPKAGDPITAMDPNVLNPMVHFIEPVHRSLARLDLTPTKSCLNAINDSWRVVMDTLSANLRWTCEGNQAALDQRMIPSEVAQRAHSHFSQAPIVFAIKTLSVTELAGWEIGSEGP